MRRFTARQALNTGLNEVEFRLQSTVVRSLPQNVDIVLTKACNLACTFCVDYETPGAKRISLPALPPTPAADRGRAPRQHARSPPPAPAPWGQASHPGRELRSDGSTWSGAAAFVTA